MRLVRTRTVLACTNAEEKEYRMPAQAIALIVIVVIGAFLSKR